MSDKPKPVRADSDSQVASLTRHRAERSGQFVPTIFDTPYRKGERINCDDPSVAYIVRVGKVRVKKQMDTQTGPILVTVDFLDKDMPLLVGRFISAANDDPELQFFADTDVIIGEYPIASLGRLLDQTRFFASFARAASDHVHGLRKALFSQLERNQRKLEEEGERKRREDALRRKIDELADLNLGAQFDLNEAQETARAALEEADRLTGQRDELAKQLAAAQRKIETLRKSNEDLRKSQEALRQSHDEEIERIAELSKERYTELRMLRQKDQEREARLWRALESLLKRLGNPPLLPSEISGLMDAEPNGAEDELPAAEAPSISGQDVDRGLMLEPTAHLAVAKDGNDQDDGDYEPVDPDDWHTPTLIPPNIEECMAERETQPSPVACPVSTKIEIRQDEPAPRAPMTTLDMEAGIPGRPAITGTLPRMPAMRHGPPPLPQTDEAGTRTAAMPAIVLPRPPQVSSPTIETRYSDADGRWSWPDDEPLFTPDEPPSSPISCPTPDDDAVGNTTQTWDVRDPDNPKPKKR